MDCSNFKELIMQYIDGEAIDTQAFEAHMKECEDCKAEFELVKSVFEASSSIGQDLSDSFTGDVMKRISKEQAKQKKRRKENIARITATLSTVAAVFVIFVGVSFFYINGNKSNNKFSGMAENNQSATANNGSYDDSSSYVANNSDTSSETDNDTSSSVEIVGGSSTNQRFELLPYSIKNIYRIDDNDTFKYVLKIDYETGKKLIGHNDTEYLCDNDIPLLMSELSIEEMEKLCNQEGITILDKCTDFSYGSLRENASYGIIYLYREVS